MKAERWKELWKKYKYACCVLLVGVCFLLLPGKEKATGSDPAAQQCHDVTTVDQAEHDLTEILAEIDRVGTVRVRLSVQATEEHVYIKDEGETVLVNRGSGTQEALERKVVYPTYQGAIVVCDGAKDAAVRLQVSEAVRQYTGLRTDQISVLPMKHQ